jgi:hypothetical protein
MPQSRTRSNRAAFRSKYRKPRRRRGGSLGWNAAIAVVVVLGIVGVLLDRSSDNASGGVKPRTADTATGRPYDHWHTFLGVDICGEWIANAPAFETAKNDPGLGNVGIHSHGDGLIHTHPFYSSEAGHNATLGKFLGYGGWGVSSDSINTWAGPSFAAKTTTWSDGDTCPGGPFKGKKGKLVWAVDGKTHTGDPSSFNQQDGQIIAIGFLPSGQKLGVPPGACSALTNIADAQGQPDFDAASPCRSATSTTTTPPASTSTP